MGLASEGRITLGKVEPRGVNKNSNRQNKIVVEIENAEKPAMLWYIVVTLLVKELKSVF